ncbi:MAG: ORF6N domain-containing protein [Pseudomonadota bacterium]|nr:ORF6N domain-containing protein [Pseudomonadota bacterium]
MFKYISFNLDKCLVQAVKRNHERFPADFMFQLTNQDYENICEPQKTHSI